MKAAAIGFLTLMSATLAIAGESKVHGMNRSALMARDALAGGMECATTRGAFPGWACIRYNKTVLLWGEEKLQGAIVTHMVSEPDRMADFLLCDAVDYLLADWKDGWQWTLAATRRAIAKGDASKTKVGEFSVTVTRQAEQGGYSFRVEIIREPNL